MQRFTTICLCAGLVFGAGGGSALAARLPDFTPSFPIEHQKLARFEDQPKTPYAMNYTDEMAESLGVVSGKADFFDTGRTSDPLMPSFKGGVDRGGAMFRLQWHPGQ